MRKFGILLAAAIAAVMSPPLHAQTPVPPRAPLLLADLDPGTNACTDFYQYASGGWLKSNPVPSAYSSWGPFQELRESNFLVLKDVLESAAKAAPTTSDPDTRKLGTFYSSCMDSAATEAAGAKPLDAHFRMIDAISNRSKLNSVIARLYSEGLSPVFGFGSDQDAKNSSLVIVSANQGGLGLPNRDYYTKTDAGSEKIRAAYVAHIAKTFELLGEPAAAAASRAARVMALENHLALASKSPVQLRDPIANYNPMPISAINAMTPAFDWNAFLSTVGVRGITSIDIGQPDYFKALNVALRDVPLDDWKSYLRWRLVGRASPYLSSAFVNEDFAFTSTLSGAREMQPRWRRCLATADNVLGDALGKQYVKVAFTSAAKQTALEMIDNLRAVMGERISKADWMTDATKQQAMAKLTSFNRKIGYPDVWRDYSKLQVVRAPWAANYLNARKFAIGRDLAKIGQPVDRGEWFMTPPTVNAYFSPQLNEIAFPAGRLQPPFFHPTYDAGANYGGIGGTIGHEMSHGFDDQGRQYDAKGNLADWWTPEDANNYTARAKVVEDQYNAYVVLDSIHVNGKLTLGENLADVVGVSVGYDALERALAGKPQTKIDGFTPEQRFFLAYAQARRSNSRDEALRLQIRTDPHSPGQFRVNGPLSNMPEFAAAFGCKDGDPMVRPASTRARIW
ncbi:MAG: M13 family metallopeptidase [Gemmatimonadaceae bacterium]